MPKPSPPIEPCRLCKTVAPLTWSHIQTAWSYKRAAKIRTPEPGSPIPANRVVNVRDGIAIYGGEQYAEYMLCKPCEDRFSIWEKYVAEHALQVDGSFPALAQAKEISRTQMHDGLWRHVSLATLDVTKLVRFAVSVTWRAHTSVRHFPTITLGPYADEIAAYLRDDATPLPSSTQVLLQLLAPDTGPPIDRVVVPPSIGRVSGCRVHHFALFGMWFQIVAGNRKPFGADACLDTSGTAFVNNGWKLVTDIVPQMLSATKKGAFARDAG